MAAPYPVDPEILDRALRGAGDIRRRAATVAAADVDADRLAGRDVRAQALRVVRLLAEAGSLDALAEGLTSGRLRIIAAELLAEPEGPPPRNQVPAKARPHRRTSKQASEPASEQARELASEPVPPAEDPVTGALPEDNPRGPLPNVLAADGAT